MADGNPVFPSIKEYGPDAATGRGLTLFNTLASNWGVQPVDGGKIVWFELPVDYPVAPIRSPTGRSASTWPASPAPELHGDADEPPQVVGPTCSASPSPCCRSRARSTRRSSASSA